jgi:hypothetical protein
MRFSTFITDRQSFWLNTFLMNISETFSADLKSAKIRHYSVLTTELFEEIIFFALFSNFFRTCRLNASKTAQKRKTPSINVSLI